MSDNDQAPGGQRPTSSTSLDPHVHRWPIPAVPSVVVDDVSLTFRSQVSSGDRGGLRGLTSMMRTPKYVEVHALKNVSFVAGEGEAIGLVGRNGSGKSTLLRVIAGLLPATSGRVWTESEPNLLGVSSVLVPQLSGERNIRLGGLAMGMTPEEVEASMPQVAAFTGIGDAVRMPMNTYSSGMAARLRFAISTQRTPRILMVDEALATGDEDFRKRSEKRIAEMRAETGTIFLVSHSLSTVRETCDRALWLDRGELKADGPPNEVCALYLDAVARGV